MSLRSPGKADQPTVLTPEQQRKVNQINAALGVTPPGSRGPGPKANQAIYDHLFSIRTFERSAEKQNSPLLIGHIDGEWPKRIQGLQDETLGARDRLDKLETGLRAQRLLHDALSELAAAFGAWHRGLTSSQVDEIDHALANMKRHYANADRLGKEGLADLKLGR